MRKITVGDFQIDVDERRAIYDVLDSGRISEWRKVREFEQRWAAFIGTRYCVATSSGFGALVCGLEALKHSKNFKKGAKVITTPLTYIATSSAINAVGFEPVYVDVDPETFGITPEAIENYIKEANDLEDYALIVPVDLMGFPVKIDEINELARKFNMEVLEDAAQAHGSIYKGKRAGSQALISTYSFYIAHNVQAGEMGACVTNDLDLSKLIRKLKAQGRACDCLVCVRDTGVCLKLKLYNEEDDYDYDPRFSHELIGYNFKTMEFQAALAIVQVEKADWIIKKRQGNVRFLNENLKKYEAILQLPVYSDDISYLAYPLVIKNSKISRKELRAELERAGIETRPLFGCIPTQQPAYVHLKANYEGKLPNAEWVGRNGFYIGCHQYLDQADLDYIVEIFEKVLDRLILKSGI